MIDQAGIMMAQGALIASERIIGVNDNMAQSHYHEYFELYYLETGERFHMVQDRCYKMTAGEFIIFPPYVMHYSYGEKDMPFKRLVLYFRQEELGSGIQRALQRTGNLPSGYKEAYTNSPDYGAAVGGAEGSGTFYGKLSQSSFKFACSCNCQGRSASGQTGETKPD